MRRLIWAFAGRALGTMSLREMGPQLKLPINVTNGPMRPQAPDAWIMFFTDYPRGLGYLVGPMRQVVISGLDYIY